MKKLLTILLALAMTGVVTAKEENSTYHRVFDIENTQKFESRSISDSKLYQTQDFQGSFIMNMDNNQLQHLRTGTRPVSFDPASNLLSIGLIDFRFVGGAFNGTTLYNYSSTDDGSTWDSTFVFEDSDELIAPMNQSLALTNMDKSADPEDVKFVYYAPIPYVGNGTGSYTQADRGTVGGLFTYYSKDFGLFSTELSGPVLGGNPNDPQYWSELKLASNLNSDLIYGFGTLSPQSDASQYGYYGYWSFDFESEADISINPEEWWTKHFFDPGNKGSSRNTPMNVGSDEDGNLYSVVNNFFSTDDQARYVAFSKSTDDGANWSTFEQMPKIIMSDFVTTVDANHDSYSNPGFSPYRKSALFVRGNDDFSYFTTLLTFKDGDTDNEFPARFFIIEARYDNGTWSVKAVEELETYGPPMFLQHESTSDNPDAFDVELQSPSGYQFLTVGNNLQMSKTADGSKLVLYWLDGNPDEYIHFEPFRVYQTITNQLTNEEEEIFEPIDSLMKYDIYSKIYNVDSDNWSDRVNLSNDEKQQYLFQVPEYITTTDKAHILNYNNVVSTEPTSLIFNFPAAVQQLMPRDIAVGMSHGVFDASKAGSSVEVSKELNFNVKLNDAYPNPVVNTTNVQVSFDIEKPAVVSLDLFNSVGTKVLNVINNQTLKGSNLGANFDVNSLNTGTYYYQLTVDGHKITKKLVVIK